MFTVMSLKGKSEAVEWIKNGKFLQNVAAYFRARQTPVCDCVKMIEKFEGPNLKFALLIQENLKGFVKLWMRLVKIQSKLWLVLDE